jgi:hypothetical protein
MIKYYMWYWLVNEMIGPSVRGRIFVKCEDQSWLKIQAIPVFRFHWCEMFSPTPSLRPPVYIADALGARQGHNPAFF